MSASRPTPPRELVPFVVAAIAGVSAAHGSATPEEIARKAVAIAHAAAAELEKLFTAEGAPDSER